MTLALKAQISHGKQTETWNCARPREDTGEDAALVTVELSVLKGSLKNPRLGTMWQGQST